MPTKIVVLFVFSLIMLFLGCKKEDNTEVPVATDLAGDAFISGQIAKPAVMPDGAGNWQLGSVPAKNISISITIAKNALYPNSSALGAIVYQGVTDSNGVFRIKIKSNATGVLARVTVDGYAGTLDTIVNQKTIVGANAVFSGFQTNVAVSMGQNSLISGNLSVVSNVLPPSLKTGTAAVTGSLGVTYFKEVVVGSNTLTIPVVVPFPSGQKIYLKLQNDPNTQAPILYTGATDGNSYFSFVINTVDDASAGFSQTADLWAPDLAASQDTIKLNGSVKKGLNGVFKSTSRAEFNLYSNENRNARHLTYSNFVAD